MTAARGIAWSLWQRYHVVLVIVLGVMSTFATTIARLGVEKTPPVVLVLGVMLLVFGYLALIGVFIHPDADVGTGGSSYPVHMFTLPVRTGQLVLWPMFLGVSTVFGSGFLLSLAARYAGSTIPLYWPAALAAAILAVLQTIFWYPLGIPYSKLCLTLIAIPALAVGVGYANACDLAESRLCLGLGAVVVVAACAAYVGLGRARCGDVRILDFDRPASATPETRVRRPFASATRAQAWYEWRLHGIVLPLLVAFLFGLFCIPLVWSDSYSPVTILPPSPNGFLPTIPTYAAAYYPVLLGLVPLAAWVIGCGARRSDVKRGDRTFHLFFATRPVSDGSLVARKLWSALRSSATAWFVLLALSLSLAAMQGGFQNLAGDEVASASQRTPVLVALAPYLDLDNLLRAGAMLVLLFALTWRNYAVGFWTELSGKVWLRYGYPAACVVAFTSFVVIQGSSEELRHWLTLPHVASILWLLVFAKLATAGVLATYLRRIGCLGPGTIGRSAAMYIAGGGTMVWIALFLSDGIRRNMYESQQARTIFENGRLMNAPLADVASSQMIAGIVVALVILWTPLVRILAAPAMLHLNRHRA